VFVYGVTVNGRIMSLSSCSSRLEALALVATADRIALAAVVV